MFAVVSDVELEPTSDTASDGEGEEDRGGDGVGRGRGGGADGPRLAPGGLVDRSWGQ